MLRFLMIIVGSFFCFIGLSQSTKPFFLGHSLVNFDMPNMVDRFAEATQKDYFYKLNVGNGANFSWHYNHPTTGQGDTWTTTLPEGGFTHFILTEAVPLKNHLLWSKTFEYADTLVSYAKLYNPLVKTYIYETWHCINSGKPIGCAWDNDSNVDWRTRLTADKTLWMDIVNHLKNNGHDDVYLVPGGQGLAKLYDAIDNGEVPGLTNIQQVFSDDIHLNLIGNYYIACIMYAVIFGESPEGLPNRLKNQWNVLYDEYPSVQQSAVLQKLAWETVCDNMDSGVNCIVNNIKKDNSYLPIEVKYESGSIYLNEKVNKIRIISIDGRLSTFCNECSSIKLPEECNKLYIIELFKQNQREVLKLQTY